MNAQVCFQEICPYVDDCIKGGDLMVSGTWDAWKTLTESSTTTTTTILRLSGLYPGQCSWAGTRRNIHSITPIMVINRPLSASSIYYDPWHPLCSIYVPDSLFVQFLSKFSLVYLLAWHSPLRTPYISSPNHCLLLAAHAHTIFFSCCSTEIMSFNPSLSLSL